MGRFASTAELYSRYREPYPPSFFKTVAERLAFSGRERLLDVGCGPGLLAIGFAPYVGSVTGIDPEEGMIAAARAAAGAAGVSLKLVQCRIEEFSSQNNFDVVTLGRSLHWLNRAATLPVLERIVSPTGRIVVCGAASVPDAATPWVKPYEAARRSWAEDPKERCYRIDHKAWFEASSFREITTITASQDYKITIEELVGRGLSKSNTSPEHLGIRRAAFEAEIATVLEPFASDGILNDHIEARASVFARYGEG